MGFCEILTIFFVVFKLLGKIEWSWFYVLLPEIIAVAGYGIFLIIIVLHSVIEEHKE